MLSGYPTRLVVNTASPLIFVLAPKLMPWKIGPSLIVNVARSNEGLVVRVLTRGGGDRGVPFTTLALNLTWMLEGLKALVVKPAAGFKAEALHIRGNIIVAMMEIVLPFLFQALFNSPTPSTGGRRCSLYTHRISTAHDPFHRRQKLLYAAIRRGARLSPTEVCPSGVRHTLRSEDRGSKSHEANSSMFSPVATIIRVSSSKGENFAGVLDQFSLRVVEIVEQAGEKKMSVQKLQELSLPEMQ